MSKTSPASIVTALAQADAGQVFFAVRLDFDSGSVYIWTGHGTVTIDGNLYLGTGTQLSISPIKESMNLAAQGVQLAFTGANAAMLSAALTEDYQNRDAYIYFGLTSAPDDNQLLFSGYMDVMTIEDAPDNAIIRLDIENKLRDLERTRPRRYTNDDQQNAYSGDTFFSFVTALQDQRIPWGRPDDIGGGGGWKPPLPK